VWYNPPMRPTQNFKLLQTLYTLIAVFLIFPRAYALNLEQEEIVIDPVDNYLEYIIGASLSAPHGFGLEGELSFYNEEEWHPSLRITAATSILLTSFALNFGYSIPTEKYVHTLSLGAVQLRDRVNGVRNDYNGLRLEYQFRNKPNDESYTGAKFFTGIDYYPDSTLIRESLGFIGISYYLDFHSRL